MMMIAGPEALTEGLSASEYETSRATVDRWWQEHVAAGHIVDGHQLEPAAAATTVRVGPGATPTITDGPFVEGKEMIGGYAILDVPDLDAAIALASGWPLPGRLELRPVVGRHED
jgi:hypothetical protein